MVSRSFPSDSPRQSSRSALVGKTTLVAAVASAGYGQQQRMLLQHPKGPWDRLGCVAKLKLQNDPENLLGSFSYLCHVSMCDCAWQNALKIRIIFMNHRSFSQAWKRRCLVHPGVTITLPVCCFSYTVSTTIDCTAAPLEVLLKETHREKGNSGSCFSQAPLRCFV